MLQSSARAGLMANLWVHARVWAGLILHGGLSLLPTMDAAALRLHRDQTGAAEGLCKSIDDLLQSSARAGPIANLWVHAKVWAGLQIACGALSAAHHGCSSFASA